MTIPNDDYEADGGEYPGQDPPSPVENKGGAQHDFLDELVQQFEGLQPAGLPEVQRIIADAIDKGLAPGMLAFLFSYIKEKSGIPVSVLKQIAKDCQNTDPAEGVLHSPQRVAIAALTYLREEYEQSVYCQGQLWTYPRDGSADDNPGRFTGNNPTEMDRFLLGRYGHFPSMPSKSQRTEVIHRITTALTDEGFFEDAPSGIPMLNRFLCYDPASETIQLLPAGPQFKARMRLEIDYDPDARAPEFMAGLARTFSDPDSFKAFLEFLGCTLLGVTPGQDNARHAMLFVGPKQSGKSTLLELVRLLVPDYATSSVSPGEWGNEYHRAALSGKTVNIVAEVGCAKISGDAFKAITGWEHVSARRPYGQPFSTRIKAWHLLACNTVPRTDDTTSAFERRFLGVAVDRTLAPDVRDPHYLDKLRGELAGVVTVAVEHGLAALRRGRFQLPRQHAAIVAEMQFGDDVFVRFAMLKVERAASTERGVSTKELQTALRRFAERDGRDTGDWNAVTGMKRVVALCRSMYGAERRQINGIPHYYGIRIVPGS